MVFNGFWQFLTVLHKQVTVFAYCTLQAPGGHVQSLPHHALVLPWNVCASSRKFLGSPCCVHAQVGSKMGAYMGTYSYTHAYLQHHGTVVILWHCSIIVHSYHGVAGMHGYNYRYPYRHPSLSQPEHVHSRRPQEFSGTSTNISRSTRAWCGSDWTWPPGACKVQYANTVTCLCKTVRNCQKPLKTIENHQPLAHFRWLQTSYLFILRS